MSRDVRPPEPLIQSVHDTAIMRRLLPLRRGSSIGSLSNRSKNCGSTSRTRSTISPITRRASEGVSLAAVVRQRRCRTIPEIVCTMAVNAATGRTYRATSIAIRFSDWRSIFCVRFGCDIGLTCQMSIRISRAAGARTVVSSIVSTHLRQLFRRSRALRRQSSDFQENPRREHTPALDPGARTAGFAARNCRRDARAETTRQIGGLRFQGRTQNAYQGRPCAKISSRADHHALLFGDLVWIDQVGRIACARRRNLRVESVRERVPQSDPVRGAF